MNKNILVMKWTRIFSFVLWEMYEISMQTVATLALGLQPNKGLAKVQAKSHISCSESVGECV
jgi:hypothetical protein